MLLKTYMPVICVILFLRLTGQGQDLHTSFFCADYEQLSDKSISCITKDSFGFMWFGTSEGLCRYDGTTVKVYKNITYDGTSLSHNEVNVILEDNNHTLWVGTSMGLNRYNRENDNFTNVDSIRHDNHLSNTFITGLACDDFGKIWIGTLGGGINIFDPKTSLLSYQWSNRKNNEYIASDYVVNIMIQNKKAWVGTRGGLRVFDTKTTLPDTRQQLDKRFSETLTTCLVPRDNNNLLIGFSNGEIRLLATDSEAGITTPFANLKAITGPAADIRGMATDHHGNLWVVTEKSGLVFLPSKEKKIRQFLPEEGNPRSAPTSSLRTMYIDNFNRIWLGTYGLGVYFIDGQREKFELYQHNPVNNASLQGNDVRAFTEDNEGNIWIAGSGGLTKLAMESRTLSNPQHLNRYFHNTLIKDAIIDGQNNLWIGTRDEGVWRINLKTFDKQKFDLTSAGIGNNKILCLYEDRSKTIWAGTLGSGLFYFDSRDGKFKLLYENDKKDNISDKSYVTSIIESADGKIWIGTLNGLFALTRQAGGGFSYKSYYKLNDPGSLSSHRVMVLYKDRSGTLWVGTFDNGLNKYNKEKDSFESYTEQNGLVNNSIKGILDDEEGNLWISSSSGILKFNPETRQSNHYTKADGLNSNNFNANACLTSSSGYFFMGGDKGFNIFHPDSIFNNLTPPIMYLTDLKIHNQSAGIDQPDSPLKKHISLTKELSLTYDQRSFVIDFVALNYGASSKNQYCYKLLGFEDSWNCVGSTHSATYTNIDPGHYVFLVKGANSDGIWSPTPARLEITIHPPLWKTWWARTLYVIVCSALFYAIMRIRMAQLRIRNQLKLEKMAREKEHELTQSKMTFFTNISHELRTPLSLIQLPLENVVSSPDVQPEIRKSLSVAYTNALNLSRLVNELMDFRKFDEVTPPLVVQRGDAIRFLTEIASTFNELAERKNIRFLLLPSTTEIQGWFDRDKLEKIIRNLLSNAFKFTLPEGEIKIVVNTTDAEHANVSGRYLEIIVHDTGIGIAPEEVPLIFNKFYQAKATAAVPQSGTGIGLSLTQMLLEAHRGSIRVESVIEKGTRFIIRLPIDRTLFHENEIQDIPVDVSEDYDDQPSKYESVIIEKNLGKPELLIIEDNEDLRRFLVAEFALEFSIVEAANGDDGFRIACEQIPDMIISDIVLPGKDGLSLCQAVKNDIRTSHIPVLLLTAKASTDDQVTGLESGADIYLPKPFSLRVLKTHVKQIIAARRKLYARYSHDVYLMPEALTSNTLDKAFLQKAVNYVNSNLLNTQLSVESMADLFNVSRSQVYRKIKALTGQTVVEFIRTIRLKQALTLMEEKRFTLSEIAFQTGFNSLSYFTRSFKDHYGKAPSEYVAGIKSE